MKTPLPTPGKWLHERCGQKVYTESQLRAAMVAAYNEAIEDAAKVCKGMTCYTYEQGTAERRAWNEATIEAGHYLTAMLKEQA